MAQLTSRGTLTRTRWDYFETSNAWASVFGSAPSGGIGAYIQNGLPGSIQIDVYAVYWFASAASPWTISLLQPPIVLAPLTPTSVEIHASQPDLGAPAIVAGMFTAVTSPFFYIQRISSSVESGIIQPIPGEPFITLPPMWGLSVGGAVASGPVEVALNVWFQSVLDTAPPAP